MSGSIGPRCRNPVHLRSCQREERRDGSESWKRAKSIPAYVERSDFIAIVAPGCLHADRRDPRHESSSQDLLSYVSKKRMVCARDSLSYLFARQDTLRTSNHIRNGNT